MSLIELFSLLTEDWRHFMLTVRDSYSRQLQMIPLEDKRAEMVVVAVVFWCCLNTESQNYCTPIRVPGCYKDQKEWNKVLIMVVHAVNNSMCTATGVTPKYLFHGRNMRAPRRRQRRRTCLIWQGSCRKVYPKKVCIGAKD